MTEQLSLVVDIYERFRGGDIDAVVNSVTENVQWKSFAPAPIPWRGLHEGPDGVREFFGIIAEHHEYLAFYPVEFCAIGNEIAVWGHYCIRNHKDGVIQHGDWSHLIKMDGDLISEFSENYDTATLVQRMASDGKQARQASGIRT